MPLDRRTLLSTGLIATGFAATTASAGAGPRARPEATAPSVLSVAPTSGDQTAEVQAAIDKAAERGVPVVLAPGRFQVGALTLRPRSHLIGTPRQSVLQFIGGATFLAAEGAPDVRLEGLVVDGDRLAMDAARATSLIALVDCEAFVLSDVVVREGLLNGIGLTRCSGRVNDCTIAGMSDAGLLSLDARGLDIAHNFVTDCANNGIQVWRSAPGDDATIISGNRIERIAAKGGGTGQNGNGVNVFRAGGVLVANNRITDCAYTAIRGNGADNIQMIGNSCSKAGEVALYAEFAFEGALISGNVVEKAASGISVTNFNEGGRLAVVQGNLIRDLFRREHEIVDVRGIGIGIEADTVVSGNVIENAPSAGISAGWGPYLRDVSITGNLIRNAGIGIAVSSDAAGGACLISNNMISRTQNGAIRTMDHAVPHGPDLASADAQPPARIVVSGNVAV
ncbi:TIGR03808 family TAT-translocated repetitive protein [Hyphomicrobium nitrativorans]|nr:TIGR03808 family TAT-translocated repetitive protein [Hyphomicrobium nitrativorans]